MEKPIEHYRQIRMQNVKARLEANNFEVFWAQNSEAAVNMVMPEIIPGGSGALIRQSQA